MGDMTDKAIDWTRQQKSLAPDKPFITYFAPGATHAPHHVPKEWADKHRSQFDQGWDVLRQETFERQKALGVIPQDAVLTERSPGIPAWDEMSETIKPALVRQMEVYAGFLDYADHHVGRLLDALEELDVLDDTLVYVIIGDNGASAEGSMRGTTNEGFTINHMNEIETEEYVAAHIDDIGTPSSYNHYAVGWAHAMDTPYQWTKQVASHWGDTRNGTIVSWPNGIAARGEIRTQFTHAIDVAPTVLQAAGIPEPTTVHGVTQRPYEGVAMNRSPRSTTRAGRRSRSTRTPGSRRTTASTTTRGSSTTWRRTGRSRMTWPPSTRTSSPTCNGCSSSRPQGSTCCRWTSARRNG